MTVTASIDDEKSNVGKYEIGKYRTNFSALTTKGLRFNGGGKGERIFAQKSGAITKSSSLYFASASPILLFCKVLARMTEGSAAGS